MDRLLVVGAECLTRTDGVVFVFAAWTVMGIVGIRNKQWSLLCPSLCALLPALFWMLFCQVNHFYSESIAITRFFWDAEKAGIIWDGIRSLCLDKQFYGISFPVFVLSLLCNSWFIWKKKDNLPLLFMTVLSLCLYMVVLYQIEYKWDSIHNVLAYSAKRFLFCFVPLIWFYAMSNRWWVLLCSKLEAALK